MITSGQRQSVREEMNNIGSIFVCWLLKIIVNGEKRTVPYFVLMYDNEKKGGMDRIWSHGWTFVEVHSSTGQ